MVYMHIQRIRRHGRDNDCSSRLSPTLGSGELANAEAISHEIDQRNAFIANRCIFRLPLILMMASSHHACENKLI